VSEDFVPTPVGTARLTWYLARGRARAVALLGHGSVTGIELVEIPSANHTFGTPAGVPRAAAMSRITTAVTEWIDRQLPID
jgi:hypothetical protein